MPRGRALTEREKGAIVALQKQGLSERAIAKAVKRSRPVVHSFLVDPAAYNTIKRPRTAKKNDTDGRATAASRSISCSAKLKNQLELPSSERRIREIFRANPNFKFEKRMASPVLTKKHKEARLMWAREKVTWDAEKWSKVVFSDKKKFNLDGRDGFQYYWHDLRHEPQIYSRRQNGGGSVMVWGAFCAQGKSELVILEGTQDSERYIYSLSEHLLPYIDRIYGRDCIFQHDNASIHSSTATKAFLDEENMMTMKRPAKSPVLNPIENMWGL
ncbi:transposable element Tc3 Transposase [Phytophthora palmivora]|uniref:Transposable element Tc3 Transposase n=1 Tax=Phytophthora palmivora TaxID=4796 RepID=A0A2P4XDB4_9STRA|nr:transposable element Tc3 Transposase [Phytophthora palmivora]